MSPTRLFLLLAATSLSWAAAAETVDLRSLIFEADIDGDGQVTRAEAKQARSKVFPTIDTDGSGALSKNEFVAVVAPIRGTTMARIGFGRVDADGNGSLSPSEWDANPLRAFEEKDTNGDGVLDAEELAAARAK